MLNQKTLQFLIAFFCLFSLNAKAQNSIEKVLSSKALDDLEQLYLWLHQHPELSLQENQTSKRLATELKNSGFEVYENFGGTGVVGVLKNGKGPTLLVRADMDALPVKEETGLPYSSTVKMKDASGNEVPVMHACGHDIHISVLAGTAKTIAQLKEKWHGTLILVGQPAEEIVVGARVMLTNGLYEKFGKPDYCLALHANAFLPAGTIGYCPEYAMANVNSINITIYGEGGHGAYPHLTKDPVVMAAKLILDIQTITSRELNAIDPAVVTVGTIHGGTKRNIVPNEVKLELTIRSYTEATRVAIIEKLRQKSKAVAISAGLSEDKYPKVEVTPESSPALYNNPELTQRISNAFKQVIGNEQVIKVPPVMVSEDFGIFGDSEPKIPVMLYWLGSIDPKRVEQYKKEGKTLPSLHSSNYFPLPRPTIETGVKTMCAGILDVLK
jgi:hippurate hydrolase